MEVAFRFIDGYAIAEVELRKVERPKTEPNGKVSKLFKTKLSARGTALRYVESVGLPEDVDALWYDLDPPSPPHKPIIEELEKFSEPFQEDNELYKGVRRIWNINLIKKLAGNDKENRLFKRFPEKIYAFDPGDNDPSPSYRLFPNDPRPDGVKANSGMITNNLGYRGIDIPIIKPEKTVRLAFVGGSTTMHNQGIPGPSYPEYVAYWLNVWAEKTGIDVRFDVANTGREAFQSHDIRGVVEHELSKIDPDFVVYYEGANQFWKGFRQLLSMRPTAFLYEPPKYDFKNEELIVRASGALAYSALLRRIALFDLDEFGPLKEVPKPPYDLGFPDQVNEGEPDVFSEHLPLMLPNIIRDLEQIRHILEGRGSELVVSSFVWLAYDGMELDGPNAKSIHWYLNGHPITWPLRYNDIRRLVDFENRVFERYTETVGISFLDIARKFPQNPIFFRDGIHKTLEGIRLHGWIAFLEILPYVKDRLARGIWPQKPKPKNDVEEMKYPFSISKVSLCKTAKYLCAGPGKSD